MPNITTDWSFGRRNTPTAYDSCIVALQFDYVIPAGQAFALNDTVELGKLDINVVPVDCFIAFDALTASAGNVSLGLLNAGKTDLDTSAASGGAVWIPATAVTSAGFVRATTAACIKTQPSETTVRSIALKITTAFTTPTAGARISVVVLARAAQ
jgi:hypothetical protein